MWKYSATFKKCYGNYGKVRHITVKYIYLHWPFPKSLFTFHLECPPVHAGENITLRVKVGAVPA
jgi:hypothetical protein